MPITGSTGDPLNMRLAVEGAVGTIWPKLPQTEWQAREVPKNSRDWLKKANEGQGRASRLPFVRGFAPGPGIRAAGRRSARLTVRSPGESVRGFFPQPTARLSSTQPQPLQFVKRLLRPGRTGISDSTGGRPGDVFSRSDSRHAPIGPGCAGPTQI